MDIDGFAALPPRSWLFVPALRSPEWLPKAIASGADAVIVDLEDATAPNEKDRAREVVRALAVAPREHPAIVVRVNAPHPEVEDDIGAAVASGADGVVLPKVDGPWQVERAARFLEENEKGGRRRAIMAMIETPRGVWNALAIADADPRVVSLMFGGGDLAAAVGSVRTDEGAEVRTARDLIALAAGAAAIGCVDTPWLDVADPSGAEREARAVRLIGFTGKFAIHPSHVRAIHAGFAPSEQEAADARGLLEAFERGISAGSGVTTYKGRMIDKPDALQAQRVLARLRA